MMEKIEITVDGNKTIAKMGDKKGVAMCSPEDVFNIFTGARIAIDKLEGTSNRYSWLKLGMTYYFPAPWKHSLVDSFTYDGGESDKMFISRGLVFRTKEEAIEAANKMLAVLKEG